MTALEQFDEIEDELWYLGRSGQDNTPEYRELSLRADELWSQLSEEDRAAWGARLLRQYESCDAGNEDGAKQGG